MKRWIALAAVGMMFCAAPALAQDAGQPGATGDTGAMSGHNPPGTAGVTSGHMGRAMHHRHARHHMRHRHHAM